MSEITPELIASRTQAGAALRAARSAAGRSVEELAAQLKVTPAKISALESGDWSALPDDTFGRALLRSCCKALKVDAQPMLDLLPGAPVLLNVQSPAADADDEMANMPDRSLPRTGDGARKSRGLLWLAMLIVALAAVVYFWPALRGLADGLLPKPASPVAESGVVHEAVPMPPQPALAASATVALQSPPALAASVPTLPASSAAASAPVVGASAPTAVAGGAALQLAATAPSWVQVTAHDGKVIFSQVLQPGSPQTVQVPAGSTPLVVVVGNAPSTTLTFAGKPVDLAPDTRANVARLTLK
ncbi:MAG: helix-turn-helix domain-containing protein [Thiomonas sp.]|nr:helix-turn-helix domain-containing protein [Thiomonas sp.]